MKLRAKSPLVCLLRGCGVEPTPDDYLSASDCDDILDAELLEVIPMALCVTNTNVVCDTTQT